MNDRAQLRDANRYLEATRDRDIPAFGPRLPVETIARFWTMLGHRQGGILNASDFGRSLDTSANSVGRYIDLLADLFLVRRLQPYATNVSKRLVKSPKLFVRDSGIFHALLGIESPIDVFAHPIVGTSWEGFVIENLVAELPFLSRAYFYRIQAGAEIDLVIERNDLSTWAIEIKRSVSVPVTRGFGQPAKACNLHAPSWSTRVTAAFPWRTVSRQLACANWQA